MLDGGVAGMSDADTYDDIFWELVDEGFQCFELGSFDFFQGLAPWRHVVCCFGRMLEGMRVDQSQEGDDCYLNE